MLVVFIFLYYFQDNTGYFRESSFIVSAMYMCKWCLFGFHELQCVFALLHEISAVIWVITVCHQCLTRLLLPTAHKQGTLVSQIDDLWINDMG